MLIRKGDSKFDILNKYLHNEQNGQDRPIDRFFIDFSRRFNTRVRPKKQYEVPVQELGCDLLSESGSSEEENLEITPCVCSEANESLLLKVLYSS